MKTTKVTGLDELFEELGMRGKEFDAVITEAVKHGTSYSGFIYGDAKGRFANGTLITTSYIVKEEQVGSYLDVQTRNSRYKVYLK